MSMPQPLVECYGPAMAAPGRRRGRRAVAMQCLT
eukprot:SAG22_NODE_16622_length_321_cov_0.936937_1_plen_33_part_10